jgi:hypothetical protein
MRKFAVLVGVIACVLAGIAFANAVATTVTGSVQAQAGSAAPRQVRLGDVLRQGETVTTGPVSSVVLRFDDGQIAALTANSRMTINAYTYNPQTQSGSVLLSVLAGGMRAISGLIGKNNPQNVGYRAATATIGIRGTDVDIVNTSAGLVVEVLDRSIVFTLPGQAPVVIEAGEAIRVGPDGTITRGAVEQVARQLEQTPEGLRILEILRDLRGLTSVINLALETGGFGILSLPQGPPGGGAGGGGGSPDDRSGGTSGR